MYSAIAVSTVVQSRVAVSVAHLLRARLVRVEYFYLFPLSYSLTRPYSFMVSVDVKHNVYNKTRVCVCVCERERERVRMEEGGGKDMVMRKSNRVHENRESEERLVSPLFHSQPAHLSFTLILPPRVRDRTWKGERVCWLDHTTRNDRGGCGPPPEQQLC